MTIYLDFDGTVVEHEYPTIGRCNFGCIEVIDKLQKSGHTVLLNTMRCEFKDGTLEKALLWFERAYFFLTIKEDNFTEFNLLPIKPTNKKFGPYFWDWNFFKENNLIIIDDHCNGIPLKKSVMANGWMVDWSEVDKQLQENGVYKTT